MTLDTGLAELVEEVKSARVRHIGVFSDDEAACRYLVSTLDNKVCGVEPLNITFIYTDSKLNVRSLCHNIELCNVASFTDWIFQEEFGLVYAPLMFDGIPPSTLGLTFQVVAESLRFNSKLFMTTASTHDYTKLFTENELRVIKNEPQSTGPGLAIVEKTLECSPVYNKQLTVGLWMSNKKLRRFFWKRVNTLEFGFAFYAQKRGVVFVPVGRDENLEPVREKGIAVPDVVIQKDGVALGYEKEDNMYPLVGNIPLPEEIPIVDHAKKARVLFNRLETAKMCGNKINVPPYFHYKASTFPDSITLEQLHTMAPGFEFPAVAKPLEAEKHDNLQVVYSLDGVKNLPFDEDGWIVQKYIPHNNVLFKVSSIGLKTSVTQRPTLDLKPDEVVAEGLKPLGQPSKLGDNVVGGSGINWHSDPPIADIEKISRDIKNVFSIDLFGFDLIQDEAGVFYVIDINYFPGYVDVPNKNYHLLKLLLEKVEK